MSTVERYVSSLCKTKFEEIANDRSRRLHVVNDPVPVKSLPRTVRWTIQRLQRAKQTVDRLEAAVEKAGYQSHRIGGSKPTREVYRVNTHAAGKTVEETALRRREAVARLKVHYGIETLGKTPKEAKALLNELARNLRAV